MTTKDFKYQTLKNTRSLLNSLFLGWHAINKNVSTDFSSAATEKKKASVFLPATHWTQLRLSHISDIFLHLSKISFKEKKKILLMVTSSNNSQRSMCNLTKQGAGPTNSSTLKKFLFGGLLHAPREQTLSGFRTSLFVVRRSHPSKTWPVKHFGTQTKWCADP